MTVAMFFAREPEELPSRAADNLFWLGRYVERAENVIRLTRAYHLRLAEAASAADSELLDDGGGASRIGWAPARIEGFPPGLGSRCSDSAANAQPRAFATGSPIDGWNGTVSDLDRTIDEHDGIRH